MSKYVVRSMTTTDADWRTRAPVTPYHIYLVPPMERGGAYWGSKYRAQLFDSPQEAEAEVARCLPRDGEYGSYVNIVPADDRDVPTYWDIQELNKPRQDAAYEARRAARKAAH